MDSKDLFERDVPLTREIVFTALGLTLTVTAASFLTFEIIGTFSQALSSRDVRLIGLESVFATVVAFLIYGNMVYQITRIAYLWRLRSHSPVSREVLDEVHGTHGPALTFLVPSYKEEIRVVRQSVFSACLQEFPGRRVVLLIDNPPAPDHADDIAMLQEVRGLVEDIHALMASAAREHVQALEAFQGRAESDPLDLEAEREYLADAYRKVAWWFEIQAASEGITDHADALFVDKVLRDPATAYRERGEALSRNRNGKEILTAQDCLREYRRLAAVFSVTVTSFERKQYANLSHEPNKAMNLNSYIGLLGKSFREVERGGRVHLEPVTGQDADLVVPAADYLITLDADSILRWDYALRLVHVMEAVGNERVAVVQTPYTAVPGAKEVLERVAGATTDIQYIIHQGFTLFGATFWVGANALLRVRALHDIVEDDVVDGVPIRRFIADRTVIEDTESSVDLVAKGWTLHNYPERMSHSATPADYGSLLVQRRRWANGGLIILPKLLRYAGAGGGSIRKVPECFMRVHYLVSIAAVNIGVPLLLMFPVEQHLRSIWFPLTAVAYFGFYARDMVLAGYRSLDIFRVYALNLLLIPVNLGGVFKSIQQGITGERIPFKRTPKIKGLTGYPRIYVHGVVALVFTCFLLAGFDIWHQRWLHSVFGAVNGSVLAYALWTYIYKPQREAVTQVAPLRLPAEASAQHTENRPAKASAGQLVG